MRIDDLYWDERRDDIYSYPFRLRDAFQREWQQFSDFERYFTIRTHEFVTMISILSDLFTRNAYRETLEVGCGFGFRALCLTPFTRSYVGIDIPHHYDAMSKYSPGKSSVEIARNLLQGSQAHRFIPCYPHQMPLPDGEFDFVYSEYVLEHIPDLDATFRELHRVTTDDVRMVHVVPITTDAIYQFLIANIRLNLKSLATAMIGSVARRFWKPWKRSYLTLNNLCVPGPHSEFLSHFAEQLDVYFLEHYLHPMIENGFVVERIIQTRECNRVIVAKKRRSSIGSMDSIG